MLGLAHSSPHRGTQGGQIPPNRVSFKSKRLKCLLLYSKPVLFIISQVLQQYRVGVTVCRVETPHNGNDPRALRESPWRPFTVLLRLS